MNTFISQYDSKIKDQTAVNTCSSKDLFKEDEREIPLVQICLNICLSLF